MRRLPDDAEPIVAAALRNLVQCGYRVLSPEGEDVSLDILNATEGDS